MLKNCLLIGSSLIALSACSILPNVGPSSQEIYNSSNQSDGSAHIVQVTKQFAESLRVPNGYGFPSSFVNAGTTDYEFIQPGDVIQVTVWENVDNGVFATLGSRVTQLQPMQVSSGGTIFVPYVGTITAQGKSPSQLRRQITNALASQTPEPQVEVQREAGDAGAVEIFNAQGGGGLIPLTAGNLRLASMLASSGGVPADAQSTTVTLTRGNQSGTILATDLFDNPSYDVALRDNDRITLEPDRRFYRILGAGGAQNMVPFDRAELSVIDAIAQNGGLNANTANPSGIFVFRKVSPEEATLIFRDRQYYEPQPVVFTIDLREPDGLFTADAFQLRSRDLIYVTEAPFVTWNKVITSITAGVTGLSSLATAGNSIGQLLPDQALGEFLPTDNILN